MSTFRLLDFNILNQSEEDRNRDQDKDEDSCENEKQEYKQTTDTTKFLIQMFGINKTGKSCSIIVENFNPFFYVLVDETWKKSTKEQFIQHIKTKMGKYYANSIKDCIIVKRKKLYGFDCGKTYKFVKIEFNSILSFNKAKNLWYSEYIQERGRTLLEDGYLFSNTKTRLYEANIPPLLRFFHICDISPSGWIMVPAKIMAMATTIEKRTHCDYELTMNLEDIYPLNEKEDRVPYKICSFDIEASSSHGDFPVPIKSYKKLATNIVEYFENLPSLLTPVMCKSMLHVIILTAFGYDNMSGIDRVYPKTTPGYVLTRGSVIKSFESWIKKPVRNFQKNNDMTTLEDYFAPEDEDDEIGSSFVLGVSGKKYLRTYSNKTATVIDILCDTKCDRESKLNEITISFNSSFPALKGDEITFIGSTFMHYGEQKPYLNHCAVLNTCAKTSDDASTVIDSYATEKEVMLAWTDLIQTENPDIIIGYNIFGFDYNFMFKRAEENDCVEQFLQLSRNEGEICATMDKDTGKYKIEESTIQIASGQHELHYIKMNGRLQIDLYNFFRREENLTSYKLDYVAGHFIGDYVKSLEYDTVEKTTLIKTSNLTGLLEQSYIHFEEIGHSVDYYNSGAKYCVTRIHRAQNSFEIVGIIQPDMTKKVRWCLAKDDVSPKDIFQMTNGSDEDRGIIAKYCIQDCNLVHYLMNKVDVLTGFIEMAKICSVPVNFLVMRGQGIKLTSYIAKKCREKGTLMPVMEKGSMDDGYEGAIVLDPKCDLYLDNPVACVDYASLYPSSMISENLSHDSKVWTKEYDLANNLICETGEKNAAGEFIYDNLADYDYVDISYDTYIYVRKTPSAAAKKVKSGRKMCRFAQFRGGEKAIMPSILEELLIARKNTRKLIPLENDEFMKNVLDKRQIGYKLTANSLYGQCGAKTSTFYEQDVAAATTATGRLLLTYAKRVIEEVYGDTVCQTANHGLVLSKAEYIYGDSVASYTPVYIRVNSGQIEIISIEELARKYGGGLWVASCEPGKQDKQFCELSGVETWTEKGWTVLRRVIRHELAPHKKMLRILTHTGLVDVTDDHSLVLRSGEEVSPKDVVVGTELLHNALPLNKNEECIITEDEAEIMGFFFGDGSCGDYNCSSGKKCSWALNNASLEIIHKYLNLCKKVYTDFEWVVMPTLDSSGVYKISPRNKTYGSIANFVRMYRKKLYYNKSKIIPLEIINSSEKIRKAFFNGLYDADGDKDINGYTRIDQKSQISASHIAWLASSIGYNTSLNIRNDKPNIYRVTMTKLKQRKNPYAIKKIKEIEYSGFVYDLTTDNHHFAAGIGNLIVHNTDSVFFTFNLQTLEGQPIRGKKALEITIELAQEAGHLASSFLKSPHDLEYEKTFMPFCLLSKKRYVGMLYETDPNKCKRKEMGIVLKRRDNAPIVKDIYGGIIDILMKKQNIQEAIDFLCSCLTNIVEEKYSMEKLIITKSLRSGYKNPKSVAHKVLADRISARDPGNKPCSGDRIPFVYINCLDSGALQGDKIETPQFIIENELKIDYSFYITNQIMKPVQQVFALVLEKIWIMQNKTAKLKKFHGDVATLRRNAVSDESFEDKVEQLKNREIKALLFDEYLRKTTNTKMGNQSLMNFFGKK